MTVYRYRCPLCDKEFKTIRGYDTHKATHRPKRLGGYSPVEWPDAEPEVIEHDEH